MSSTTKTMILAAVILVAAIAGVALAEDTDAASVQVTYHLGDATIPVTTAEDGTVVLYGPEDVASFYIVPDGKSFVAWQTQEDGGTIYQFGATIAVSAATDLYPRLVDVAQEVTFIAGDATATAEISGGHVTVPEIETDLEGSTFDGWLYSGDGRVYTAEEVASLDVKAGDTFTAQYSPIYDVVWIIDGVTVATGDTTDTKQPADPVKDHYTFTGWEDADGVMLSDEYEISEDTTFTAVFEPVMLTVTFTAGTETVATVSVPYGQMVVMPALPEGYSAWDFDFSTPIVESITVQAVASAVEPSETFTVTFVVDGKTIATAGFNARDMDYSQGVTTSGREIAIALGVPPELVGDSANKTYSNAQEANREFALHTIMPQADRFFGALSTRICPHYPGVAYIGYDRASIDGLKGDEATMLAALESCTYLTVNEKRARLGYEPVPDGDVILAPMGSAPLSELATPITDLVGEDPYGGS